MLPDFVVFLCPFPILFIAVRAFVQQGSPAFVGMEALAFLDSVLVFPQLFNFSFKFSNRASLSEASKPTILLLQKQKGALVQVHVLLLLLGRHSAVLVLVLGL